MVRPSSRGGVPVFSRPCPNPISRICPANAIDAASSLRPPSTMLPNEHPRVEECTRGDDQSPARQGADAGHQTGDLATPNNNLQRFANDELDATVFEQLANRLAIQKAVRLNARSPNRGPFASVEHSAVNRAHCGPRHQTVEASSSRTRCPLPTPPIDGFHDIWPASPARNVSKPTLAPRRAAPAAASQPAWPPPITRTSNTTQALTDQCFTWNITCRDKSGKNASSTSSIPARPVSRSNAPACQAQILRPRGLRLRRRRRLQSLRRFADVQRLTAIQCDQTLPRKQRFRLLPHPLQERPQSLASHRTATGPSGAAPRCSRSALPWTLIARG